MLLSFKLERKNLLFLCIKIVVVIFISLHEDPHDVRKN